ncbi:hypothetical protein SASPL_115371 [Salvia splendens]|uniref:Alcohol dehydrogenase-like C-terminal domain-containing protein n=1 Tax=Salvia splendens TaxID=180675 RepID=A0A8X9A1J6_SALSN|nr:hypothetical protein SASPL_115371 [Salvia splendens]
MCRNTVPGDVYLKVMCCGICHTDIHQIKNDLGMFNYPMVPGCKGLIHLSGFNFFHLEHLNLALNRLVMWLELAASSGVVAAVTHARQTSSNTATRGFGPTTIVYTDGKPTQGGFASAMVVDQKFVVKIPDGMAPEQAAPLLCAGVTVYSPLNHFGLKQSGLRGGILGLGGVGHMGVINAKAMGRHVTVISSSDRKREEALDHLGADDYLVSSDAGRMQEAADSLDYIIDTIPVNHPLEPYLYTENRWQADLDGSYQYPFTVCQPNDHACNAWRRKRITGSVVGSMNEQEELLEFCKDKNLSSTIETVKMDYINTAFERLEKNDVRYRFVVDVAGSTLEQ